MTRTEILKELEKLGYTGPTSYTKDKLTAVLEVQARIAELLAPTACPDRRPPTTNPELPPTPPWKKIHVPATNKCSTSVTHCENCGSEDREDTDPFANDGYSACCNELLVNYTTCRNHHAEA